MKSLIEVTTTFSFCLKQASAFSPQENYVKRGATGIVTEFA